MKKTILLIAAAGLSAQAYAGGAISVGPYASVSSSKTIKPKVGAQANSAEEVQTQRLTMGVKVEIRLFRFFSFSVSGGQNKVDINKKASVMRDEFGEINFAKDADVSYSNADALYQYKETQNMATATGNFTPSFGPVQFKFGIGARGRQRIVSITDKAADTTKKINDPLRWHAVGNAGVHVNLMRFIKFGVDYKFYFIKFPDLQPHEQEVSVSMGVSLGGGR